MENRFDDETLERIRRLWRWPLLRWRMKGMLGTPRRALVRIRWRLGDEVMAIPIYEALRTRHPDCRIAVECSYSDLLVDNPFVDAINPVAWKADRYIMLRGAPRGVYRIEHYARRAKVPKPDARPRLYYRDWDTPVLEGIQKPFVAVSSGASWPTKRWPTDSWRDLCIELEKMGYAIVELGQGDEQIGVGTCLVDKTTVREAACILHAARFCVCCDSGLMHLARAAGTPTLALFGPTEPTILIRDDPDFFAIKSEVPCQGCWNISKEMKEPGICPLNHANCLECVQPGYVLGRVREVLDPD